MTEQPTIELIRQIAQVQGAIFLKDLLRRKKKAGVKISVGGTKDEVLASLEKSVEDGLVSEQDVRDWLDEVEGWGRQHAYLFVPSERLLKRKLWDSPRGFEEELRDGGVRIPRSKTHWLAFPEKLTLAELSYDGTRCQAVWHQGSSEARRDETLDETAQDEGDIIEYRAYRRIQTRSVMRYVLFPASRTAGLFIQLPLGEEHDAARNEAHRYLQAVLPGHDANPVSIAESIKKLDRAASKGGQLQPLNTRLSAKGACVEFDADTAVGSYLAVEAVRRVRNAVDMDAFSGETAKFNLDLASGTGMKRRVRMAMNGRQGRIYLFSRMTAQEVWTVLAPVFVE